MSKKKFSPPVTNVAEEAALEAAGWWYCLEARHPGAREVIDDSRFFQADPASDAPCPVCPGCGRQVTAVPVEGAGVFPSSLLALADRLS